MNRLAMAAFFLLAVPASALQIVFPPPLTPSAPTNLNPIGAVDAASPVLRWRQGGFFATQPQPPRAQFFHICIYDVAIRQTCSAPAVDWTYAAADPALHRTPVVPPRNPSQITSTYEYWFQFPVGTLGLDRPLTWNVGACTSQALNSCTYSAPATLRLSTRNILVPAINEMIYTARITMTPDIENSGMADSGEFEMNMRIVRAIIDPSELCATAVSSENVMPGDVAVTSRGEEIVLESSDIDGVVGIYRPPSFPEVERTDRISVPAGTTIQGPTVDQAFRVEDLPAAYLLMVQTDIGDSIAEFDETDNWRVECHVVFPPE
jgi:hypothetical protein